MEKLKGLVLKQIKTGDGSLFYATASKAVKRMKIK